MKYNNLTFQPRVLRPVAAAEYAGGRGMLETLVKHFGLKPFVQRNRNTSYDVHDIDLALDRLKSEGWPT